MTEKSALSSYQDADDNSVTGQQIDTGDDSTTAFQLVHSFGGFIEPVLASNVVGAVKLNGITQSGGSYSVSNWGSTTPGVLIFNSAPGSGVVITADFSFYWPCRMDGDNVSFNMFLSGFYAAKKFSFISVKN